MRVVHTGLAFSRSFGRVHRVVRRDEKVFGALRAWGVPVAWNLAGGYQRDAQGSIEPVLAIHDNTLRAFANTWNIRADAPTDPARANAMAV